MNNSKHTPGPWKLLEALIHIQREICEGEFVKHSKDAIRKLESVVTKTTGGAE